MTAARARRAIACAALVALAGWATAVAADPATGWLARPWLTFGVLGGVTRFDSHLADYGWNVDPRAGWGAEAMAGAGRFGGGVRAWRAVTRQHVADADVTDPAVVATRLELVGRVRVASWRGARLDACASAGRLHFGYQPDHVVITPAGGAPIAVALAGIGAWSTGAGLALRRGLTGGWDAGVEIDAQRFAMNTAHRSGSAVLTRRESFGEWNARFQIARVYGRR